jgi:hypothetical protein
LWVAGSSNFPDDRLPPEEIMKGKLFLIVALFIAWNGASAQSAADSAAIRTAALDYVEGFYEGSAERMARALHPELVKRIIARDTLTKRDWISQMGAAQLINATARGGGRNTPAERRTREVKILDIYETVASVRATMSGWIDYMHLARIDGRWQIVNVLWENHPRR